MEIAPFKIKRLFLDDARMRVRIKSVTAAAGNDDDFPAYLVVSTAPHNIDQAMEPPTSQALQETKQGLAAIAQDLHRIQKDPTITQPPEIVIVVHGYNTAESGIQAWYSDMYRHIAQDDRSIRQRRNLVFIGYRWSSEQLSLHPIQLWRNLRALPDVPQAALIVGILFVLAYGVWPLIWEPWWNNGLANFIGPAILNIAVGVSVMIATLLLLRTTVYFRDVYRAINFGVPDLTELVRQIDQSIDVLNREDLKANHPDPIEAMRIASRIASGEVLGDEARYGKIKLNFLGHSMGGLVITNVVRILSDVFDRRSIAQNPIPDIGHNLSLGRLVLASPDVPVLSIISSRSNGLASSLRRFSETYLFSNEGDLALRLASTAANYISFPSARQHHGHRLGSVALTKTKKQGIINLASLRRYYPITRPLGEAILTDDQDILNSLYITHSSGKGDGYLSLGELFSRENNKEQRVSLADLFTFFDCTDYRDYKLFLDANGRRDRTQKKVGLLTRAKQKKHLALWDYIEMIFLCFRKRLDVHGGYFNGEYSRQLMYRLAFLGFDGMLRALDADSEALAAAPDDDPYVPERSLDMFDQRCMDKGIQVYLSPLRYRVDVQGADLYATKENIMRTVQPVSLSQEVSEEVASTIPEQPAPEQSKTLAG
ncbi:MAG: hypothetical protein AAFP09_07085 [Cyanobacteria bacterium J06607_10]